MDLGERLQQARLASGLSQRQLCGDMITRNMLSQIENGNARPSMDTLRYLAGRLGKPMGYFLEEQAVLSPNLQVMEKARSGTGQEVLDALSAYQAPDAQFDRERYLLEALTCLELARKALNENRKGLAASFLERAEKAGGNTPYYTPELECRRQLLCYEAGTKKAHEITVDEALLLVQAQAMLEAGEPSRCRGILEAVSDRNEKWHFLQAEALLAESRFPEAAEHYKQAQESLQVYARLEQCYREMEDYQQAYFYACKQRE